MHRWLTICTIPINYFFVLFLPTVPTEVVNLDIKQGGPNGDECHSLHLTWQEPNNPYGIIDKYQLSYKVWSGSTDSLTIFSDHLGFP